MHLIADPRSLADWSRFVTCLYTNLVLAGVGCGLEAGGGGHLMGQLVQIYKAAIADHSN